MNPNALRGLAALCLLCVLPRLGALTVTHNTTAVVGGGASAGMIGSGSHVWDVPQLNPALGALHSVAISGSISATVTSWELNPNAAPFTTNLTPYFHSNVFLGGGSIFNVGWKYVGGEIVEVQAGGAAAISVLQFSDSYSFTLGPNDLAAFIGNASVALTLVHGAYTSARYGGVGFTSNDAVSVTYTYGVPDAGHSLGMIVVAMTLIFLHHRRRSLNLPGV